MQLTMLSELANLTQANNHTRAALMIARHYPDCGNAAIFEAIVELHNAEQSLPSEVFQYRTRKVDEMLEKIGDKYGLEAKHELYQCL